MDSTQIYALVNSVNEQAFGEKSLTVVDTSTLIALGDTVLSSSSNTEAFLNTLAQRIGRTIISYRAYRNKLGDMVLSDFEYGAILQKIDIEIPDAEEDDMYELEDGESLDHYKVSKPEVIQKLFVTRTPYRYKITIQRSLLKEAFLGLNQMDSFISVVFGKVRNAIEVGLENLARVTMATMIAECSSDREITLLTDYNTEYDVSLTADEAIHTDSFLRYAIARINTVIDGIQDMCELYNDGSIKRFTPKEDIRVRILSPFKRRLETVTQYAAFHDSLVDIDHGYEVLNFWQSAESPYDVNIKRPSDKENTQVNDIVAIVYDRDMMGVYKIDEDVATTPVNAAGLYYNTFWHEKQLRFIDLSENGVIFTLT